MKSLLKVMSGVVLLAMSSCSLLTDTKFVINNTSGYTITDIQIGIHDPKATIKIDALAPNATKEMVLSFKDVEKASGKYWLKLGNSVIDSFGEYKSGLPVATHYTINLRGDDVQVISN
jgi:hypothetical protein